MSVCFLFDRRTSTVWVFGGALCDLYRDSLVLRSSVIESPETLSEIPPQVFQYPMVGRLRIESAEVREVYLDHALAPPDKGEPAVCAFSAVAGQPFRTVAQGVYIFCIFDSNVARLTYNELADITLRACTDG
jgi:hypothetical protein